MFEILKASLFGFSRLQSQRAQAQNKSIAYGYATCQLHNAIKARPAGSNEATASFYRALPGDDRLLSAEIWKQKSRPIITQLPLPWWEKGAFSFLTWVVVAWGGKMHRVLLIKVDTHPISTLNPHETVVVWILVHGK